MKSKLTEAALILPGIVMLVVLSVACMVCGMLSVFMAVTK